MRYRTTSRFDRSIQRLDLRRKVRIQEAIQQLVAAFETGQLPSGLGVKLLRQGGVWELRAGLADRVVFRRTGDLVEFILAGDHGDIRRFLRDL